MPRFWHKHRRRRVLAVLVAVVAAAGCGPDPEFRTTPPTTNGVKHVASSGDELLALAPGGAQWVFELDLARLRNNSVVGEMVKKVGQSDLELGHYSPFRDADLVVLCVYGAGTASADTLTLVKSKKPVNMPGSIAIASDVYAVAAETLQARLTQVESGELGSILDDQVLMSVRDRAVPKGAVGASVRITANLDFDSRLAMARLFDMARVPTSVSLWGDVADDLAVVGYLTAEDAKSAVVLSKKVVAMRERLAELPVVRRLVLSYLVRSVEVAPTAKDTRLTLIVAPRRLQLLSRRLGRYLAQAQETASGDRTPARPKENP